MAALMPQGKQQYFTAGGIPLVGGKVYTYVAGTTTPLATYTTTAASTPNTNPVILDSRGEASIFFSAANYKIVVKDSLDSTIWTQDNLPGDQAATILANLAASTGSSLVGHIASGTGAVATTVQTVLRERVSVFSFLPEAQIAYIKAYNFAAQDAAIVTAGMQAAHNTGVLVDYPNGGYLFSRVTIANGGISGHGKTTILRTNDTTTGHVITYTGVDPSGVLINTPGALFENFSLEATSPTQKSSGGGIAIIPADYGGSPNENYLTIVSGIYIKNIPTSLHFTLASYFSVRDSYFSFFTVAGIYAAIDNATFQDNGDNEIIGNFFFTNAATSPSGRCIWYRCGGARIIGNKINGGIIGVDIHPLRGTSVAIIQGNSIENQTINAVRGYIDSSFTATGAIDGFSFMQVIGNQIGGYLLAGGAISINSYAADPKFYNCTIDSNIIYNPANAASRAIDVRQVDRYSVTNNFVDSAGVGYGAFYAAATATSGLVSGNNFLRPSGASDPNNIGNDSTTTVIDHIRSQYSGLQTIETVAASGILDAGATWAAGISAKARIGDYVEVSIGANIGNCQVTGGVYATDAVLVVVYNATAAPIAIGSVLVKFRVLSS